MRRKPAGPTVAARSYELADGTTTETWSVRFRQPDGTRVRRTFATREEADFEKARVVLELSRHGSSAAVRSGRPERSAAHVSPSPTVAEFWETYLADARSRLARSTVESYEGDYRRRLKARFGEVAMGEIRPCPVSQWRAATLADGTERDGVGGAGVAGCPRSEARPLCCGREIQTRRPSQGAVVEAPRRGSRAEGPP
jgi:Phage integrase, N-terminal SAM-like domain